jgi:hypothetical protein
MFGSFDVFSIFSRMRFDDHYHTGLKSSTSDLNKSQTQTNTPAALKTAPAQIMPPVVETKPTDKIELSKADADDNKTATPTTYTPESVKAAADQSAATTTPATTTPATTEEPPAEDASAQNQLVKSKSLAKLNLKMAFSMSDFQSLVSAVADDAKDGKIDSTSYSNLSLGLRTELDAQAYVKETYKLAEGQDGADQSTNSQEKLKYNNLEASLVKSRGYEASSFYRESMKTNFRIQQNVRGDFMQVARKLSMRYTQDFRMDMKTMSQFNGQAESLDQTGQLQSYLGSAEALVDSPQASGELIGKFFDTVDTYLNGAEDKLIEKINSFFDNLASEMGIDSKMLSAAKETLVSNISSFFDKVDQAISSVKVNYVAPQTAPTPTIPTPEPTATTSDEPDLVGTSEALAAA